MINIGFLLHAYQPPTQKQAIIDRVLSESYEPVIALAERYPGFSFSMDIAKSLAEHLPAEFLGRIRHLYAKKKIELVNTAAYHFLLPLHNARTIKRQLAVNAEFYRQKFIGNNPLPGVFLPELAFSPDVAAIIKSAGYSWLLAEDISYFYTRLGKPPENQMPINWVPSSWGLGVMLRSGMWSKRIAFGEYDSLEGYVNSFLAGQQDWRVRSRVNYNSYCILAMDMETFGHHRRGTIETFLEPFIYRLASRSDICALTPFESLSQLFPKEASDEFFIPASWSTTLDDLRSDISFPLWNHPQNPFHVLWNNFRARTEIIAPHPAPQELERLLDAAFYSCPAWQYARGNKELAAACLPKFKLLIAALENDSILNSLYKKMSVLLQQ